MYSQNFEDEVIAEYFGNFQGTLIDIGANDGKTLSNSLFFIDKGWKAHLFEPNKNVFEKLSNLHKSNSKVLCWNLGIADFDGEREFYESGSLISKDDYSLVSTLHEDEMKRWGESVQFTKTKVKFRKWETWCKSVFVTPETTFDYISIDAEGEDWSILQQIDLNRFKTQVLCVEWNSVKRNEELFTEYASNLYKMKEIHRNAENLIFAKF